MPWWSVIIWSTVFVTGASLMLFLVRDLPDIMALATVHALLLALLTALTIFDFRQGILPDVFTFSLIGFGVFWNYWQFGAILEPVTGAIIGFAIFWLFDLIWRRRTGSSGLGRGDAKLLAGGGALLGPLHIPALMLIASAGALIAASMERVFLFKTMRSAETSPKQLIAFGPYICAAIWLIWCVQ